MSHSKVAGAPISWGVCEVPGWGVQLKPSRVLAEMADLGITATEAGPDGFLPSDPDQCRRLLEDHDLSLVAGFVPVVLHRSESWEDEKEAAAHRIRLLAGAGAEVAIIAASTGDEDYEETRFLDSPEWDRLGRSLNELEAIAEATGVDLAVHPHYGTVIETPHQIDRFLQVSDTAVCLDTGHIMVGSGDPLSLAKSLAERIGHVHLKDVDAALAFRASRRELGYREAVARGMYRPLGHGDIDFTALLAVLDETGFEGWLVLEQDLVLTDEPPAEGGPRLQAEASLRFLEEAMAARSA